MECRSCDRPKRPLIQRRINQGLIPIASPVQRMRPAPVAFDNVDQLVNRAVLAEDNVAVVDLVLGADSLHLLGVDLG